MKARLPISTPLVLCALTLANCIGHKDQPSDWHCYVESGAGNPFPTQSGSENIGVAVSALTVDQGTLWPVGERAINVCWLDSTWDGDNYAEYRDAVRQVVTEQWENNLATTEDGTPIPDEKRVHFVGWAKCSEQAPEVVQSGVTITIADDRPWSYLGTDSQIVSSSGQPSMLLNFQFKQWSKSCSDLGKLTIKKCVKSVAVHEFGHALGFSHEQNRSDTPESCQDEKSADGDFYGGTWDMSSVMNYCNDDWNNGGELSPNDQRWSRVIYYPEYYPGVHCDQLTGDQADGKGVRPDPGMFSQ